MNSVNFPLDELNRAVDSVVREFETGRRDTCEIIGTQLLSFVKQAYLTKSQGGTGDDGITWAPLKVGTPAKINSKTATRRRNRRQQTKTKPALRAHEIGRDTGLQLNSATPGFMGPDGSGGNIFTQDEVSFTVGFGRNYSQYFDKWRKLIPDVLPASWQEELERLAAERGSQLIDTALRAKKVD